MSLALNPSAPLGPVNPSADGICPECGARNTQKKKVAPALLYSRWKVIEGGALAYQCNSCGWKRPLSAEKDIYSSGDLNARSQDHPQTLGGIGESPVAEKCSNEAVACGDGEPVTTTNTVECKAHGGQVDEIAGASEVGNFQSDHLLINFDGDQLQQCEESSEPTANDSKISDAERIGLSDDDSNKNKYERNTTRLASTDTDVSKQDRKIMSRELPPVATTLQTSIFAAPCLSLTNGHKGAPEVPPDPMCRGGGLEPTNEATFGSAGQVLPTIWEVCDQGQSDDGFSSISSKVGHIVSHVEVSEVSDLVDEEMNKTETSSKNAEERDPTSAGLKHADNQRVMSPDQSIIFEQQPLLSQGCNTDAARERNLMEKDVIMQNGKAVIEEIRMGNCAMPPSPPQPRDEGEQAEYYDICTPRTSNRKPPPGCSYRGSYDKDGLFHGCGELVWGNGDRFVGRFHHGMRHGRGILSFADGSEYAGRWELNKKHGQGIRRSSNGDVYVGNFAHDKRNGRGCYTYANGDRYEGSFKDGRMDGFGRYYFHNKNIFEGKFCKGKKHGWGKIIWGNGKTDINIYASDRLMEGVRFSADGKKAWRLEGDKAKRVSLKEALKIFAKSGMESTEKIAFPLNEC